MRQVLVNLLSNACNHAPEHSIVTLSCVRDGSVIEISVADTGPGITPDILDLVFERFERGASNSRRRGSGLGLALVKSFVELHGGSVAIDTAPERGTKVICRLPAAPSAYFVAAE